MIAREGREGKGVDRNLPGTGVAWEAARSPAANGAARRAREVAVAAGILLRRRT